MAIWNPFHGCHKISPGCMHCYVYRRDREFGKDSTIVTKTTNFSLPLQKNRRGEYKLCPEEESVFCCMTSDFFLDDADPWRRDLWAMIRERSDLSFIIITKRIQRFLVELPDDWGTGYPNVTILCTCEDQIRADGRLAYFLQLPVLHKGIICEPLLEQIDLRTALASGQIESVTCGGESGDDGRLCDYAWVLDLMNQCVAADVPFHFKQTGTNFKRGNRIYRIERKDQMVQAAKAGIDYRYN